MGKIRDCFRFVLCSQDLRIMFKWKGSFYKMIWPEFLLFMILSVLVRVGYYFLNESFQRVVEMIGAYCNEYRAGVPLFFVLGFFVSQIINRYWLQLKSLPWTSELSMFVVTYITGKDDQSRMIRRTIMRYICAGQIITFTSISPSIKRRFPTLDHISNAGFLLPSEIQLLNDLPTALTKYFVPFIWATNVVNQAYKEGRINNYIAYNHLIKGINDFRGKCGMLYCYDMVIIPLAYTQVVIYAVYIFCLACLLGKYNFDMNGNLEDIISILTIFQFIFYMGWLKVALAGLNVFGDDDDNLNLNVLVDMSLHESYMVVDQMFKDYIVPDIIKDKDKFWDDVDFPLPYTPNSLKYHKQFYMGSSYDFHVPENKYGLVDIFRADNESNFKKPLEKVYPRRQITILPKKRKINFSTRKALEQAKGEQSDLHNSGTK